jgi:hypothetical protein
MHTEAGSNPVKSSGFKTIAPIHSHGVIVIVMATPGAVRLSQMGDDVPLSRSSSKRWNV